MMERGTPTVTKMQVIPVAGRDSMLMTLSGAHAPFFTRNLVILEDSAGHTGIGEIHGGDYTCDALKSCIPLVVGQPIGTYRKILDRIHKASKKSEEDDGEGICFAVYAYNVQPGVEIDYATGESWLAEDGAAAA